VAELTLEDGELWRKISHQLICWLTANSLMPEESSGHHWVLFPLVLKASSLAIPHSRCFPLDFTEIH
jgi:hypothetical protein